MSNRSYDLVGLLGVFSAAVAGILLIDPWLGVFAAVGVTGGLYLVIKFL